MFEPLCAALDAAGIACTRNELLADHCTFRIGGPADIFIKPCDEIQLCRAVAFCKEQGARYYLLGNGSNILFEDAGFRGAVLDLTAMKTGIGMKENIPGEESGVVYCSVTVGAGMKLSAAAGTKSSGKMPVRNRPTSLTCSSLTMPSRRASSSKIRP